MAAGPERSPKPAGTGSEPACVIVPDFLVGELAPRIAGAWPGAGVIGIDEHGRVQGDPHGAVALFRYFPNDRFPEVFKGDRIDALIDELPALRLLQTNSAGVDGLLTPRLAASPVALCNAGTVHSRPVAESVLALMLAVAKRLPFHVRNQTSEAWQRTSKLELRGSTVAIVGFGRIGQEVAGLCRAFGMEVIGVRRKPGASEAGVRVVGLDGLDDALACADWVVLTLPLDDASRGLISAARLDRMRSTACLVNVARGEVVDEDALVERLSDGRLAHACLDVFRHEPLPAGHPLWRLPNVLVTPHNAASSPHMEERVIALFLDNLGRLARGETLLNEVPKPRARGLHPA